MGGLQPVSNPDYTHPLHGDVPCWYAIRTRSRHEKFVAKQLDGIEVETFLPLSNEVRRWSDRQKEVEMPLLPGYAFVRLLYSPDERVRILRTPGVVGFVGTQGRGMPIPDHQIDDIKVLLNNNVSFKKHETLYVGQRVRIRGGSLDGVEGILQAKKNTRILVISIAAIQRALSVDLDGYDVEVI